MSQQKTKDFLKKFKDEIECASKKIIDLKAQGLFPRKTSKKIMNQMKEERRKIIILIYGSYPTHQNAPIDKMLASPKKYPLGEVKRYFKVR